MLLTVVHNASINNFGQKSLKNISDYFPKLWGIATSNVRHYVQPLVHVVKLLSFLNDFRKLHSDLCFFPFFITEKQNANMFPHILAGFEDSAFFALEERRTRFPVANDLVSRLNLPSRSVEKEESTGLKREETGNASTRNRKGEGFPHV